MLFTILIHHISAKGAPVARLAARNEPPFGISMEPDVAGAGEFFEIPRTDDRRRFDLPVIVDHILHDPI